MLTVAGFPAIRLEVGKDELLLALGEPARLGGLVNNNDERQQSH